MTTASYDIAHSVSGLTALETAGRNRHSRFNGGPASATERLWARVPVPVHFAPKFVLTRADAVFTMGSCFARNVEYALVQNGIRVLLGDFQFPLELFDPKHAQRARLAEAQHAHVITRSVLNKYSPLSMLHEFRQVLAPELCSARHKGLVHIDGDRWFDPQAKDTGPHNLKDSLLVRHLVEGATRKVTQASAVFLTLGLTETWLDGETNTVLNFAPPPLLIKKWPERFRFFNATYVDVLDSLEQIYGLIATRVRPDMKFVVTVSPVPLNTTFTDKDVIAANTYSKSILRAAAETFCGRHDNVDYFPSYEMVMSTYPELAWQKDRIHVTQELVDSVIGRFVKGFFPEVGDTQAAAPAVA